MNTNEPKKMEALIADQHADNQRQNLLNALEAASQAFTTASILIEKVGAKTQADIDKIIAGIGK